MTGTPHPQRTTPQEGTHMSTEYSTDGDVAVIRMAKPPVNGLGHALRVGIADGLDRAAADDSVRAVVITGSDGFFSAGADITEFGSDKATASPNLSELIKRVEDSPKPVVAAVDGTAFGGGLELSLGTHYRVASASSKIGLPEVKLGLIPGAGGTQRLPRLLDPAVVAEIVATGAPRTAAAVARIDGQQLFDEVVDDSADVVQAAVALARSVAGTAPVRTRDRAPLAGGDLDAVADKVLRRARGQEAPAVGLDLVRTALTTGFDEGKAAESAAFAKLVTGGQSAALRYAFFAERAARKIPGIDAAVQPRVVERVGVVGAGTMGGGIAMNFLNAGIPVTILEMAQDALDRGLATIRSNYQAQVDKGKLSAEKLEQRMGLLTPSMQYSDLATADLIIEAVFEDMEVKKQVFTRLDEVAKPGAVLASNTSTLDVDKIAEFTDRPADVLGMHFFSPANVMALLEVVRGAKTADDVLVTALDLGKRVGKTPVVSGVCDGFIGNRMLHKYRDAAMALLRAGATPHQVDKAIEGFGFAMGPFRMQDLAGGDIGWAVRKRQYAENPDMPRDEIADELCEMGRYGQKTGAGWYDYESGSRAPKVSTVVHELLERFHHRHGTDRQEFSDEEIAQRLVFALTDEGARILDEGIALRASDIDLVYLAGYGFPRYRGGPMFYADRVGLPEVVEKLRGFHAGDIVDGKPWEPAPLLVRRAEEGASLT
ncbi:3-hydroxyacyl-CoA dehydrogenase NAD-binding domain-containing protein [Tomitella gaofuii]|uniref:3-hydroxyacyl-CoA dehydrogenase NAD-binding domain-containing protein n=1 Tax=Tomitella gaofuii TaxID=2760083 RepID=UPI001F3FD4F8|nr:3-hydroxyacyl-CoA dehydrogenase NAD-binding domain-containing protein [Tomitella gaofuii]